MAVLIIELGTEDQLLQLDSPLGTVGNLGAVVTIDSEEMAVLSGLGSSCLHVERGDGGTDKAAHAIGSTVTLTNSGGAAIPIPTLADVLAAGNTAGGTTIAGAKGYIDLDSNTFILFQGGDETVGTAGHAVQIAGGNVAGGSGADIELGGAGADESNGKFKVFTNASAGNSGEALMSDGAGKTVWGGITVGSGAPTLAPDGKLPIYLDSGASYKLYVWDGAAWRAP